MEDPLSVLLEGGWRERKTTAWLIAVARRAEFRDRYLRRPDLYYDQTVALGALMNLDATLGTEHARRFLAPGGLWQQWLHGPPTKDHDPARSQQLVSQLCAFAADSAAAAFAGTR
ncbi:DUF6000 family protein [Streptacidiphilus cavernicola]|uniref:DUF6000 family protein n=1 Tax=Streptacidiphilus cavernicola TaxID=3342716 RepID=A0ABV6VZB6_9ACTN